MPVARGPVSVTEPKPLPAATAAAKVDPTVVSQARTMMEALPEVVTVSVIVPAHNEQAHAPRAARSILASEWPALEVIFVLDRCTDGTLEALAPIAAADPRLKIVQNHDCPADWAGKCNAARVGARHATGDLLLFTDADIEFHPQLLRATVAILKHRGLSLLSLLASPRVRHWFEAVVQPVAALMLMRMYPIPRVNDPKNPRAFANGQFLLFERGMYEKLGGHAIVRDDLLEDIAFARRVRDAGGRGGLCTAEHLLSVEMYESMAEFHRGWKRIYLEAAERKPSRLRALALESLLCGALFPMAGVAAVLAGSCSAATLGQIAAFAGPHLTLDTDAICRGEPVAEKALAWARERLGKAPILLSASQSPDAVKALQARYGVDGSSHAIEKTMAALARGLVEAGVKRLVVAGGETSGAVVGALDVTALRIGPEIDPGVPWTASEGARPLLLALKSGNFGAPDFFTKAFARL